MTPTREQFKVFIASTKKAQEKEDDLDKAFNIMFDDIKLLFLNKNWDITQDLCLIICASCILILYLHQTSTYSRKYFIFSYED